MLPAIACPRLMPMSSTVFIAAFFSILGFIFNLGLLGVVVEMIRSTISRFRAEYLSIIANDHLVVLGWSEKTLFLLAEAAQMLSDRAERGTLTMVILSEMNALEMKAEVKIVYPDWRKRWPRDRLPARCERISQGTT